MTLRIGDGTERIDPESSREQTQRTRAFCESIKPVSTSHQKMLDAIETQLATLAEIDQGAEIGRVLWLCHRQLHVLQAASSALVIEMHDRFTDTEEIPTITPEGEADLIRRFGQPEAVAVD